MLLPADRPATETGMLKPWRHHPCGENGTILITQGADDVQGSRTRFVHAPVRLTLRAGFAAEKRRHGCRVIELIADTGWHRDLMDPLHRGWASLRSGDLVIHIGSHRYGAVGDYLERARELKARGVRCVLYQMEPFAQRFGHGAIDGLYEVWDYSWRNVDQWRSGSRERRGTPCRYVPTTWSASGSQHSARSRRGKTRERLCSST